MAKRRSATEKKMWRRTGSQEKGFEYLESDDTPVRDEAALERIRSLAIPPAWTEVRIAPGERSKVQALGYDAAGRKQYIYHQSFVRKNARRKFRKLLPFARILPQLRAATNEHLRQEGLGRERVLATVVRLMVRAFFRVGSERYAVRNRTFGIATLEKRHLSIEGNSLVFSYRGKSSIDQRRVPLGRRESEQVERGAIEAREGDRKQPFEGKALALLGREHPWEPTHEGVGRLLDALHETINPRKPLLEGRPPDFAVHQIARAVAVHAERGEISEVVRLDDQFLARRLDHVSFDRKLLADLLSHQVGR